MKEKAQSLILAQGTKRSGTVGKTVPKTDTETVAKVLVFIVTKAIKLATDLVIETMYVLQKTRGRSHSPGQFQANGTVGRRYDNQRSPVQDSNSPNGDFGKEIRTCCFCRNKGHIKRECRKFSMWKDSKGIGRPKQRQN